MVFDGNTRKPSRSNGRARAENLPDDEAASRPSANHATHFVRLAKGTPSAWSEVESARHVDPLPHVRRRGLDEKLRARMTPVPKAKRVECIRLRVELQLSTPAIAKRVGISNFSAYRILAKHPWFPREPAARDGARATWSRDEIATLVRLWPVADPAALCAAIPRRKYENMQKKASELGLRRRMPGARKNKRFVHPIFVQLRAAREAKGLTRPQLAERLGYHFHQIHCWEMGKTQPSLRNVDEWATALGFSLMLSASGSSAVSAIVVDRQSLMAGRAHVHRNAHASTDARRQPSVSAPEAPDAPR